MSQADSILRRTILAELEGSQSVLGNFVTQPTLLELVKCRLPEVTLADLVAALSWLRDKSWVDFMPDTIEPDNADLRRWWITPKGKVARNS